jgi:hypothetical protein
MGIYELTNLGETTTFYLIVLFVIGYGVAPKCHFSRDSQVGGLEILKFGILMTLEAHNFLCKPPIEMKFKEKL